MSLPCLVFSIELPVPVLQR